MSSTVWLLQQLAARESADSRQKASVDNTPGHGMWYGNTTGSMALACFFQYKFTGL